MIKCIQLSPEIASKYEILHPDGVNNTISGLSKINIFIGSNNSGKSRLMRELIKSKNYHYKPIAIDLGEIESEEIRVREYFSDISTKMKKGQKHLADDVLNKLGEIWLNINTKSSNINLRDAIDKLRQVIPHYHNVFTVIDDKQYKTSDLIQSWIEDYLNPLQEKIDMVNKGSHEFSSHYIPILRGLKPVFFGRGVDENLYVDVYTKRTVDDYSIDITTDKKGHLVNIYSGLTLYDEINSLIRLDSKERKRKKKFEDFLSASFFNNKHVEITPNKDGKIYIEIDEGEDPIEQLGDGIQSVIILTFPLFMNQGKYALFFFEEPETHLHPGFQRLFIETLRRPEFSTFQYFMSTHSNHFLDITLENNDMSVYTFKKEPRENNTYKFKVENLASGDDNVLQLIGANKSSVFLSNCTIWVEGITDRIYLRRYLDLYQDSIRNQTEVKFYKEDYHYSFVEYGGGNITHWSFLDSEDEEHKNINIDRLCAKAFVITDSDEAKAGSKKKKRQDALEARLGKKRYYCLEAREIENLLTRDVIVNVIKDYEAHDTVIDGGSLNDSDIISKPLGRLIETKVKGMKNKNKYAKESGTINDKIGFAKKAINHMNDFNELNPEAQELTKRLYAFIKEHNS